MTRLPPRRVVGHAERVLHRGIGLGLALCALVLAPTPARADVVAPAEAACRDAEVGEPCALGDEGGACVESSCSRLDYSAGTPPRTASFPCRICEVGTVPTAGGPGGRWLVILALPIVIAISAALALRRRHGRGKRR